MGVPLIVMMFPAQLAVTPEGKPAAVPIPVATVVLCVILVITVFCVTDGLDEAAPTEQAAKGITPFEGFDWGEFPTALVAVTVKL